MSNIVDVTMPNATVEIPDAIEPKGSGTTLK